MIDDLEEKDMALEERARARVGVTLRDKYHLDRVLGSGAMATVYAATHRNGNEVALKLLHPEVAHDPDLRSRFLREGYVANQVKHAGAVSVIDDDVTEEGWAFLVMERLEGLTVQQLLEDRGPRLHPASVTAISLQLLDVMASAHLHGIIHRDIKPANLFLTREGELKVLDFGIARMRDLGAQATTAGCVLGTPAFMAPEQAMARSTDIDEKTDLWAIGSVAFALLAGEVVHPAENTQQTLVHAATRPARSLGALVPDAPEGIVRVFDRALLFDKAARWASANEMRDALARAAEEAFGEIPGAAVLAEACGVPASTTAARASASAGAPTLSARRSLSSGAKPGDRVTLRGLVAAVPQPLRARARRVVNVATGLSAVALGIFVLRATSPTALPLAEGAVATSAAPVRDLVASRLVGTESPPSVVALLAPAVPLGPEAPHVSSATARPHVGTPSVAASLAPSPAPAVSHAATHCNPPFVIDLVTHRKVWKMDCL
jgi:tRNA A-37 threonylcarbamoyl transferase component Bud32